MAPQQEKRTDPEDGGVYTFDELSVFYKSKYKKNVIQQYWDETCKPMKKGKNNDKGNVKKAAEPKAKAKPKFTMGYWNIRGLAAPLRMMFEYASADYNDNQYDLKVKGPGDFDGSAWVEADKPGLQEKNALMNLPYVKLGDKVVTQSNACYLFVGKKLNLNGRGEDAVTSNIQILCEAFDLRNVVISMVYPPPFGLISEAGEFKAKMKEHLTDGGGAKSYGKFEGYLKQKGTTFFSGSKPCSGDFHVWEMIDQHELMCKDVGAPSLVDQYPLMKALYEKFKGLPQLESYFKSDAYKFPVNQKFANFK